MNCKECTEHTGMVARMLNLEKTAEHHQAYIDEIKKRMNQILGASLLAAIGLIGNLFLKLVH